ncbi:hypothetical protein NC651_027221 [Populus alba x Populus x berolinensis]|nr:hypothetical protein NC651_027221 [Populus alba x Populus x berolinensis]
MTYKITMGKQEQEEKSKKNLAFKILNHVNNGNKKESSKEAFRCFKCNKTRHIKVDCPFSQNKKNNYLYKQAMKAT